METPESAVETLIERMEAYGKTTIELSKLKALDTATVVVTSLVAKLSVIIMITLFAILFSIGIAQVLGELLGKTYYGFFIVAAAYLLAGIVFHFFLHGWIKKPVCDLIISQTLQ